MANVGLWHDVARRQVSGTCEKGSSHWATKPRRIKTQNNKCGYWEEDTDKITKFNQKKY